MTFLVCHQPVSSKLAFETPSTAAEISERLETRGLIYLSEGFEERWTSADLDQSKAAIAYSETVLIPFLFRSRSRTLFFARNVLEANSGSRRRSNIMSRCWITSNSRDRKLGQSETTDQPEMKLKWMNRISALGRVNFAREQKHEQTLMSF